MAPGGPKAPCPMDMSSGGGWRNRTTRGAAPERLSRHPAHASAMISRHNAAMASRWSQSLDARATGRLASRGDEGPEPDNPASANATSRAV